MSGLANCAARIFHGDVAAPRAISFGPISARRRRASSALSPRVVSTSNLEAMSAPRVCAHRDNAIHGLEAVTEWDTRSAVAFLYEVHQLVDEVAPFAGTLDVEHLGRARLHVARQKDAGDAPERRACGAGAVARV